jgi:hypothetical protein
VCNYDGKSRRTIISSDIKKPQSIFYYDRKLYVLDPLYEIIARYDLSSTTPSNQVYMRRNSEELKTLTVFYKRDR